MVSDADGKDYNVALNITETEVDDPDPVLHENYVCGAKRNYTGYCNPEVDKLVERQSTESDIEKRKRLVWEIERKLAEDDAARSCSICKTPIARGLKSKG